MKIKKRNILFGLIGLSILCTGAVTATQVLIPEKVYILEGQQQNFNYGLPFNAKINGENIGVMSINDEQVEGNIEIDLAKPFTAFVEEAGQASVDLRLGGIPVKNVSVYVLPETSLVPCGSTVGVTLKTTGILVLGVGVVLDDNNIEKEPAKGILKTGDLIIKANGVDLNTKEDLVEAVEDKNGENVQLTVKRDGELSDIEISPVKSSADDSYKLGVWVRDSTQGIGTVTYYNPVNKSFGALGHGVYDVDTKQLMDLKDGKITESNITGVKKGEQGVPGEILGNLIKTNELGEVLKNSQYGLYGVVNSDKTNFFEGEAIPIATKNQIVEGKAEIITTVDGNKTERFEVEILSVNKVSSSADKGMVIKITDQRLLDKTNGIVQGM